MNRREFIKTSLSAGSFILLSSGSFSSNLPVIRSNLSRIIIARDQKVQSTKRSINIDKLEQLVDRAVMTFLDIDSPVEAWKKIVKPSDTVGIKVNCLAGTGISTTLELVEVVVEKLAETGVKKSKIVIWDRLNSDLERAGFKINTRGKGPRCFGNDTGGYDQELTISGSIGSLLSRTLSQYCSVQINLPILKDHGIVGLTASLKNYFGGIHNPNKYHDRLGDPYIADLNLIPYIRQRTKLIICDVLTSQYDCGPPYMPQYCWQYNGLLVGQDPVAIDQIGWNIIEEKRKEKGLKSLKEEGREPTYIATAADLKHRIGNNDLNMIDAIYI